MATYRIKSLEELGPALEGFLAKALPALYTALRAEIAERAMLRVVELSPVGPPAKDPHPGKYRGAHQASAGTLQTKHLPDLPAYPLPGIPEVSAALQAAGPEVPVFIANAAASDRDPTESYAGLLEGGRRQYSRRKSRKAQWVGSLQAPDGIYGPAVDELKGDRATIEAAAVARVKL